MTCKVCPVCKVTFYGYYSRIYCTKSCQDKAYYQRDKGKMTSEVQEGMLMQTLNEEYGIQPHQIPAKSDIAFLEDLLLAMRIIFKQ